MQNFNLNDLLRYGFAGAVFLILMAVGFERPQVLLEKDFTNAFVVAALSGVALTVGCVLYALHRAVPYPALYLLFSKLNHRVGSSIDLDVTRWKNGAKTNSLQSKMSDWGAQVHFLYCIAWAGFSSLLLGHLADWKRTNLWVSILGLSVTFLVSALWHHFRYQKWEKRVFEEDAKIVEAPVAKPKDA